MIYSNKVVSSQKFDEVIDRLKTVQETMNNKYEEEAAKAVEEAKGNEDVRGSENASVSAFRHFDVLNRAATLVSTDDG